ncbi:MAG TPA: DUF72 domain-containing protein [Dictyobacter sp.]|nr:DUF72 domain-containing protein [Dictyobacter sp.]
MLYIGCPMWGYKDWVGNLFPARTPASDFLRLYSQTFPTVEGNTIFYATPGSDTIQKWVQETPASFRFCPKISRTISHDGPLATKQQETAAFVERMRLLGERLGPLFLQLPPSFHPDALAQLQTFLDCWPTDLRLAVEIRHPAFFQKQHSAALNALLQRYQVARVIMDTRPIQIGTPQEQQLYQTRERKPLLPVETTTTTDFAFVRYIGHPRLEDNTTLFEIWAEQIAEWLQQGRTVYVFCHCPYEVHSPAICYEFYRHIQARVTLPDLPQQPQTQESDSIEQMHLF